MRDFVFPAALANAKVLFWTCLNKEHKLVTWDGDVAECDDCGLTSEMTARYARSVQRFTREQLKPALGWLATICATSSRDWSLDQGDAWIYGIVLGWTCDEDHEADEHDDNCGGNWPLDAVAERHLWDQPEIERLNGFHAAIRTVIDASSDGSYE